MIILHNRHSAKSRAFVKAHKAGHTVIDWFGDSAGRGWYFKQGYPSPGAFPSVVDRDARVLMRKPSCPEDLSNTLGKKSIKPGTRLVFDDS